MKKIILLIILFIFSVCQSNNILSHLGKRFSQIKSSILDTIKNHPKTSLLISPIFWAFTHSTFIKINFAIRQAQQKNYKNATKFILDIPLYPFIELPFSLFQSKAWNREICPTKEPLYFGPFRWCPLLGTIKNFWEGKKWNAIKNKSNTDPK